jgi:THO complex subunit 2
VLKAASKKKKDKERWVQLIDKLKSEQREQENNNQCVMAWLKHERDSWFPSSEKNCYKMPKDLVD